MKYTALLMTMATFVEAMNLAVMQSEESEITDAELFDYMHSGALVIDGEEAEVDDAATTEEAEQTEEVAEEAEQKKKYCDYWCRTQRAWNKMVTGIYGTTIETGKKMAYGAAALNE